ncbi:terminase small subunit [Burkholderia pyrrocinia]
MALTAKKRKFADALMAGRSNKAAAIAAGYSPATASQAGSRLVKDKDVKAYLLKQGYDGVKPDAKPIDIPDTPEARRAADDAKKAAAAATRAANSARAAGFDLDKLMTFKDPMDFLLAVMNDQESEQKVRVQAAISLMPFKHAKKGEQGKKEQQADAAKAAASKFGGPPPSPKLAASGGKRV